MSQNYDFSITLKKLRRLLYSTGRSSIRVCGLYTFDIYSAYELFPYLGKGMERLTTLYRGHIIEVGSASQRLACFKRSRVCVQCGKVGTIMLLQATRAIPYFHNIEPPSLAKPHLNLYHVDDAGHFHLMTQDHILPKSKGGSDSLINLQTMCGDCNTKKGSTTN